MSKHVLTVVVAVVIAVSLLLYMFAYQVRTSDKAVLMTFGKPSTQELAPGYHFKLPWPIQDVRRFDNRLHVEPGNEKKRRIEEIRTKDNHNVLVSVCVGWEIKDVLKFNENFGSAEDVEDVAWNRLETIIRNRVSQVFGSHDLSDLVSTDVKQLKYDEIENEAQTKASADAENSFGIRIALLKLRRLELPESATKSVYERMKKDREKEAQDIKSRGDEEAQVIKSTAEYTKARILSEARAEADRIRGDGDAKAASYYKDFKDDPKLAVYLRELKALREIARKNTTIILDATAAPWKWLVEPSPTPAVGQTKSAAQ